MSERPDIASGCDGARFTNRRLRLADGAPGDAKLQWSIRPDLSLSSQNVFVTESTGLVSLDIDTGRLVERVDLGQLEGSTTGRGGGVVLSGADDALYRIGGNGPPERRTSTLELVWRAERIAGLRAQSWIRRIGLLVGDSLWISPGAGWPIYAYNTATGALTSRFGLLDGQGIPNPEPAAIYGDVQGMTRIQNIDGENNPGVLITTDDGILYAVRDDLTVAWSKQYDSSIGTPLIYRIKVTRHSA